MVSRTIKKRDGFFWVSVALVEDIVSIYLIQMLRSIYLHAIAGSDGVG